ncbi:hypothetical protein ACWGKQ_26970 [Streptomyces sp. NPDC054770]
MNYTKSILSRLLAVVLLAATGVLALPAAAQADPYQCYRQGGEYRAYCAKVTAVAAGATLPLQQDAGYDSGQVPNTAYENGDELALACWTEGEPDQGGHGDT